MSVSGMVEIPRRFNSAQRVLQAKQKFVMPLENGIQVTGMGMDPGFHRGDDKAWIPAFAGMTVGVNIRSAWSRGIFNLESIDSCHEDFL